MKFSSVLELNTVCTVIQKRVNESIEVANKKIMDGFKMKDYMEHPEVEMMLKLEQLYGQVNDLEKEITGLEAKLGFSCYNRSGFNHESILNRAKDIYSKKSGCREIIFLDDIREKVVMSQSKDLEEVVDQVVRSILR